MRWTGLAAAIGLAAALGIGYAAGARAEGGKVDTRVFELRTYTAHPGRIDALNARFRDHTCRLFEKHGMTNIAYWMPREQAVEGKPGEAKLIYVIAHKSREAADANWKAFREDPDWIAAKNASEKDGPIVAKVESVYLNPTDYSPMK